MCVAVITCECNYTAKYTVIISAKLSPVASSPGGHSHTLVSIETVHWKILQEKLLCLCSNPFKLKHLICTIFNTATCWNQSNTASNTRYSLSAGYPYLQICVWMHIKMHFSGQRKHLHLQKEMLVSYISAHKLHHKKHRLQVRVKKNIFIYTYVHIEFMCQATRKNKSCLSAIETTHFIFIWFLLLLRGYFGFLQWLMLFPLVWILIVFWHFHLFLYFLNKDCCNVF